VAPDAIIGPLGGAAGASDFVVAGAGWAARGRVRPATGGGSPSLELQPATAYADGGGRDDDASGAGAGAGVRGRTAAALLAPGVLAVSFVQGGAGANASLTTRIGTASATAAGGVAWGEPASRPGAYLWHALARMDGSSYLLAFPAVEAAADGAAPPSTVAAGGALVVVAATLEAPPAAAGAGGPAAARVVLSQGAVLDSVRAHYYIDAASVSPSLAVVVFVDAAINDGIRAVLVELRPDRSLIFGATLVLNSGHGGGGGAAGGAWLHLALTPMVDGGAGAGGGGVAGGFRAPPGGYAANSLF